MSQTYTINLLSKKIIAHDMLELVFSRPENFTFKAGQFVQFFIPQELGEVLLRSYSISSHPEADQLEFCVKLIPQGKGSTFFNKLELLQQATLRGPEGRFVCLPEQSSDKIFIATGAGLAPIMSMVSNEVENEKSKQIYLLFGVRTEEDIFWLERFEHLKSEYENFDFNITLSRPLESWQGWKGRVTEHLPEVKEVANYYLCGSLGMVKDVRTFLVAQGVQMKNIHFEIF
jgi:ferredoxin-NADP reductase